MNVPKKLTICFCSIKSQYINNSKIFLQFLQNQLLIYQISMTWTLLLKLYLYLILVTLEWQLKVRQYCIILGLYMLHIGHRICLLLTQEYITKVNNLFYMKLFLFLLSYISIFTEFIYLEIEFIQSWCTV